MSENNKNIIKTQTQTNEKSAGEIQDNDVLEIRKKGRPRKNINDTIQDIDDDKKKKRS